MRYPIPQKSVQAWQAHRSDPKQNPGLIFDRFIPDLSTVPDKERGEVKKESLDAVIEAQGKADKDLLEYWNARWQKATEADSAAGEFVFTLATDWRLIAGLGRKGPLEIGFTFHRYGFPILPGSSVKGLARASAFYEIVEELKLEGEALEDLDKALCKDEEKDFKAKYEGLPTTITEKAWRLARNFRQVFGTIGSAGQAVFFDAIPEKLPSLDLDIMNPHYPDYYQGKEPPTNWQKPNPIIFLTVAAGQSFRFAVGWRGELDVDLQKIARDWLVNGLTELGLGSKTSAGYGFFKPSEAMASTISSATTKSAKAIPSTKPAGASLKDLAWRRGKVSRDGRAITTAEHPDEKLFFRREHVLPKGYTPAARAEVDFAVEPLPDGSQCVWVKKLYHKIE